MKKLILKTTAITLASVLAVCLLTFGILGLFFPAPLARLFDKTGGYSASVYFYEKQYKKTGDINDLANLVVKIDEEKDSERAEIFLADLVYHKDFDSFCNEQDNDNKQGVSTREYYVGSYASVLVRNGKFVSAVIVADGYVDEFGYTAFNPYSVIIMKNGKSMGNSNLTSLYQTIEEYKTKGQITIAGQLNNLEADLQSIKNIQG